MQLQELLYGVSIQSIVGKPDQQVAALAFDSRLVVTGTMFFAIKGTASDGHLYIAQTIATGAAVIVCESIPEEVAAGITYVQVADSAVALGIVSSNFYGNPSNQLQLV